MFVFSLCRNELLKKELNKMERKTTMIETNNNFEIIETKNECSIDKGGSSVTFVKYPKKFFTIVSKIGINDRQIKNKTIIIIETTSAIYR